MKKVLAIIFLLLLLPLSYSFPAYIDISPIKSECNVGETCKALVTIENIVEKRIEVRLFSIFGGFTEDHFFLDPGEKKKIIYSRVIESEGIIPSVLYFYVTYNGKVYPYKMIVIFRGVIPEFKCSIAVPDKVTKYINVSAKCNKKVSHIVVKINKDGRVLHKAVIRGDKGTIELDPRIFPPGTYTAIIKVIGKEDTYEYSKNLSVLEYGKLECRHTEEEKFFSKKYYIVCKNTGNVPRYAEYRIPYNGIFFTGNAKKEDGQLIIDIGIVGVGESRSASVSVVKKTLLAVPLVALACAAAVLALFYPPILVSKEYRMLGDMIKVVLTIKYRGLAAQIKNLIVEDYIPEFADKERISFETLAGEVKDNKVVWRIDQMSRGDAVVIIYTFPMRIKIYGRLKAKNPVVISPLGIFKGSVRYK